MNAIVEWENAEQSPALEWLIESAEADAAPAAYLASAGSGALTGATAGAALGPYGALAGGLIGAATGALGTASASGAFNRRRPRRPRPSQRPAPAAQPAPQPAGANLNDLVAQLRQLVPLLATLVVQANGGGALASLGAPTQARDLQEMMPELDDETAYGDYASEDDYESEDFAEDFSPSCANQPQAPSYA